MGSSWEAHFFGYCIPAMDFDRFGVTELPDLFWMSFGTHTERYDTPARNGPYSTSGLLIQGVMSYGTSVRAAVHGISAVERVVLHRGRSRVGDEHSGRESGAVACASCTSAGMPWTSRHISLKNDTSLCAFN